MLIARLLAALSVLLTVGGLASTDAGSKSAAGTDLTGRWLLDEARSDTRPEPGGAEDPAGGDGVRRPPVGGLGGGMRSGGRGGGGGVRQPGLEERARMRAAMRAALEAPPELIVTRSGDDLVFTAAGSGEVRKFRPDGEKRPTTAGGVQHDVKALYKGGGLVVESAFGALKVIDTWRISPGGGQLVRTTTVKGLRGPGGAGQRELRRVYDRVILESSQAGPRPG